MENNKFLSRDKTQALIDELGVKQTEGKSFLDGLAAKGYTIEGYNDQKKVEAPKQTFLERVSASAKKTGEEYQKTKTEAELRQEAGQQSGLSTGFQTGAAAAKGAVGTVLSPVKVVAEDVFGGIGDLINKGREAQKQADLQAIEAGTLKPEDALSNKPYFEDQLKSLAGALMQKVQPTKEEFDKLSPEVKANLEAVGNLAGASFDVATTLGGGKVLKEAGGKLLTKAGETTVEALAGAKALAAKTGEVVAPIATGVADITKSVGRGIATVPKNIATNVGELQAAEKAIKTLARPTAQNAARGGIEIVDVNSLENLVKTPQAQALIEKVKSFAAGTSKVDPIEVVGKPITQKIKSLNQQAETIGKELGKEAENLGILDNEVVQNSVLSRLQRVSGLKGLKVADDGALDFSDTTLKSVFTEADRSAIETAFKEAVDSGSGKQAHMFRQELFEVLDGKKRSLSNITDTQDKALNAIRSGLSDVIELNNPKYKELSNQYRKLVQPLSDLRKLSKNLDPNNPQDILDLSAGLLARRLTSAAASNPTVRLVLKKLDDATKIKGGTLTETQDIQDLYNVLNKYYDIAPKTGFQNLVKEGTSIPTGITDTAMSAVKSFAGKTNAVRQKALEDYIDDLLKTSKVQK